CPPDVRERVVRAFGAGRGLLVGQARRDGRERPVFGNREVFGVGTKRAAEPDEPEHPVAGREGRDTVAGRLDFPGKLVPEDRLAGPDEPGEESGKERLARADTAVGPIYGGGVNLDEQLVVLGGRLFNL